MRTFVPLGYRFTEKTFFFLSTSKNYIRWYFKKITFTTINVDLCVNKSNYYVDAIDSNDIRLM